VFKSENNKINLLFFYHDDSKWSDAIVDLDFVNIYLNGKPIILAFNKAFGSDGAIFLDVLTYDGKKYIINKNLIRRL